MSRESQEKPGTEPNAAPADIKTLLSSSLLAPAFPTALSPGESGVYLDCHSTTPVDPQVLQAMLPYFSVEFGNPGSQSHGWGTAVGERVDQARTQFAAGIGADPAEVVFTSGSTESNNLAIRGIAQRLKHRRQGLITIATEHPSVLQPMQKLASEGWNLALAPIVQHQAGAEQDRRIGQVDLAALEAMVNEQTALVSIALANNEMGVIQPIAEIAQIVHRAGGLLHTDASQVVGWLPIDVRHWQADLISFSAHKFYGPKGVGALYVRGSETYAGARPVRPLAQTIGGGQEFGFRSGTLNVPGIIGIAAAMQIAGNTWSSAARHVSQMRDQMWQQLLAARPDLLLNGPALAPELRLPNNLNFAVPGIEGQSIMIHSPQVAMSSGSACSSAHPGVSTVLTAIGRNEDVARASLRIGLGRFHTPAQIQWAAGHVLQGIEIAGQ